VKAKPIASQYNIFERFYRFFRLAVIITINYIYQLFGFEIALSIFGLLLFVLMPFILFEMGSTIEGNYFIRKSVSVRMGSYSHFKFRSMKNDSESDGAVFFRNGDSGVTDWEIYANPHRRISLLMY
jgi:hypothetical protein